MEGVGRPTDLYHPHQALRVLGENGGEGLHWQPQHRGVSGCPSRHSTLGVLVTLEVWGGMRRIKVRGCVSPLTAPQPFLTPIT